MTLRGRAGAPVLGALLLAAGCGTPPGRELCTARRSDLILTVEGTGTLRAESSASITPPPILDVWIFKILWMAPEGLAVHQGDPVVAFDTDSLEQEAQKKRVERDQAAK
jgi:multidrug efflux pump subunit AcrA (membrane-fusion protein)